MAYYYPYSYGQNTYQQQYQPMNYMLPQAAPPPQTISPQPSPMLNGKIVDSEDMVKATEVPIGGYGIFPKADLSEIYVKSWNSNGTTNLLTFKPIIPKSTDNSPNDPSSQALDALLQKVSILESKIDTILSIKNNNAPIQIKEIQKEGVKNAQ